VEYNIIFASRKQQQKAKRKRNKRRTPPLLENKLVCKDVALTEYSNEC
jgi:hypothetical protein